MCVSQIPCSDFSTCSTAQLGRTYCDMSDPTFTPISGCLISVATIRRTPILIVAGRRNPFVAHKRSFRCKPPRGRELRFDAECALDANHKKTLGHKFVKSFRSCVFCAVQRGCCLP